MALQKAAIKSAKSQPQTGGRAEGDWVKALDDAFFLFSMFKAVGGSSGCSGVGLWEAWGGGGGG